MKISDQMMKALEDLKSVNNYEMIYDEIIIILEDNCDDAYARGYLTHYLEVESDSLYGKALFEQFVDFVKRIQANSN